MFRVVARAIVATVFLAAAVPSAASAAVTTFGSDLTAAAVFNTAKDVLPNNHDGADTAMWNVALGNGSSPAAPAGGQITEVKVRGCTQLDPAAPNATLGVGFGGTEIHFQDLVPHADGTLTVNVTTQGFSLPVCTATGQDTVTSFAPTNFCVQQGDFVDLNDEGGFDPKFYPNGIPYFVIGRVAGSTMHSFIRNNGTNNGATISPTDVQRTNGYRVNQGKELLLQATLATGPDATPLCPGGTKGQTTTSPGTGSGTDPSPKPGPATTAPSAPVTLHRQTDGVNHRRIVHVAIFCAKKVPCSGSAKLTARRARASAVTVFGHARFKIAARRTGKVAIKLTPRTMTQLRRHHKRLSATLSVTVDARTVSAPVTLKI